MNFNNIHNIWKKDRDLAIVALFTFAVLLITICHSFAVTAAEDFEFEWLSKPTNYRGAF